MSEKKKMGFAAMDPAKQKAIAKAGGAAVPPSKRSFATNKELAKTAGKQGGLATHLTKKNKPK